MKIYCLYSPSHKRLFADYFLPSVPDELSVCSFVQKEQQGNGDYANGGGWLYHVGSKLDLWAEACRDNIGEVFICADVDLQFFGPVKDVILSLMGDNDVLTQMNSPKQESCTGFMACCGSERLAVFWEKTKAQMIEVNDVWFSDQEAFNLLRDEIKWEHLPFDQFYTIGMLLPHNGWVWDPSQPVAKVPRKILMHHANWTVGKNNKRILLDKVRDIVDKNKRKGA